MSVRLVLPTLTLCFRAFAALAFLPRLRPGETHSSGEKQLFSFLEASARWERRPRDSPCTLPTTSSREKIQAPPLPDALSCQVLLRGEAPTGGLLCCS